VSGQRVSVAAWIHLIVIYVVWGSTYLAIRVAVREGAGWGPFWLGAARVAVAGCLLLAFNALRGRRVVPSWSDLVVVAVSGTLMWVGGNGGVNWAEQRVDSGLAALIVGSMPLWAALIEALLDRRRPSGRLMTALATGFVGLAVLSAPRLEGGLHGDAVGLAVVVAGTISWAIGSIVVSRRAVEFGPTVMSGWQQLIGAVGFVALAVATGEGTPHPTPEAWAAWGYLVVFGSLLAFTSYLKALRMLPTPIVMTYTYVNPVIAVALGWLVLDERVTGSMVVGMLLVLVGVAAVFHDRRRRVEPT
jgi:drug/metabolite transporter (DMT)-like permease